jgi:hypothetical protein
MNFYSCFKKTLGLIFLLLVLLLPTIIGLKPNRFSAAQGLTPSATAPVPPTTVEAWRPFFEPTVECLLPCWWGIVLGQTNIQEAQLLLLQAIPAFEDAQSPFNIPRLPNEAGFVQTVGTLIDDEINPLRFSLTLGSTNGVVDVISMGGSIADITDYFDLFNLLEIYGTPSSIRLGADQTGPGERGLTASRLLVEWKTIGLAIPYRRREIINASGASPVPFTPQCFNHTDVIYTVTLHDPQKTLRLDEITDADERSLRRIEEVTDYSIEEFVQLLINNNGCLPSDLLVDKSRPTFTPTPTLTATQTSSPTFTPTLTPTPTATPSPTPIPCPSNSACFTVGNFRGVQYTGDPRVYIERSMAAGIDPFDSPPTDGWTLIGRTNGAGDNGVLRAFTVLNNVPYAALQHPTKGCIVVTPRSLGPRTQGQTRLVNIIEQGNSARCNGDWSGLVGS